MITQTYLNDEIDLASRIFLFYSDKMLEYAGINSFVYLKWYIDSMQLHFLLEVLQAIELDGEDNYLGYDTVTDDFILGVFYKVREYYLADVDEEYVQTDLNDIIIPTGNTYTPYPSNWQYVNIPITSDGTTQFTLPFDMADIDANSIVVTVDDSNPIPTNTGEGYYIDNNIFYWTYYFDLNTDNIVHIKYLKIKG